MFSSLEIPLVDLVKPPVLLMREGRFPDCPRVFEEIARAADDPRALGRRFTMLCRLTGFAWAFWVANFTMSCTLFFIHLYHWGRGAQLSEPWYFGLSCQMVVAVMVAVLFVGYVIYKAMTALSLELSAACRQHARPAGTPAPLGPAVYATAPVLQ